jgi:osmotically-inducible protein OsmY
MHRPAATTEDPSFPRRGQGTGFLARLLGPGWAALVVGMVLALPVRPTHAGDSPREPGDATATMRDLRLAVQVRQILNADPALARLNLNIRVRDGTVVLNGPVPSVELAHKALRKAEKIGGILRVRSELYLARGAEREPISLPLTDEAPTHTQSASPDPALGTLTGRVPVIVLPPSGRTSSVPPAPAPAPGPEPAPPPAVPPPETPSPAVSGVSLLAPVTDPPPTPPGPSPRAARAPVPGADPLTSAVERLCQGDPRFRGIHVEVSGGLVLLRGPGVPGEHVMALAQALSVLPGVERVRVQNSTPPGR